MIYQQQMVSMIFRNHSKNLLLIHPVGTSPNSAFFEHIRNFCLDFTMVVYEKIHFEPHINCYVHFWPGEAKFWDKVNTDSDCSNPHMMLGGATHVMVLPLVFKEDAH